MRDTKKQQPINYHLIIAVVRLPSSSVTKGHVVDFSNTLLRVALQNAQMVNPRWLCFAIFTFLGHPVIQAQMVNPRWLCFAIFTFLGHPVIQDACQQFTLSSPPKGAYSCPGSNITYTCVLSSSSSGAAITVWTGSAFQCPATSNQLSLTQKSAGVLNPTAGGQCGSLSAVTTNISNDGLCFTSVLTIPALQALNGTTVMCKDGVNSAVVGNDTVMVTAIPGSFGTMILNSTFVNELTVVWTPPTTGGVPTSYNVSINDSSSPVVIPDNGSSLYTHTFTGLISDTLYTVSVVAINCAGTSNVTSKTRLTVAVPPNSDSIRTTFLLYANNTLCLLNITWTPVGGSVTMYKVRVVAGDGTSAGQGSATCRPTTSPCIYVQQVSVFNTTYTIFVASINGDGDVGPENSSTIRVINNITSVRYGAFTASFQCSFWDNQSYCLVCCSTDPSVSPDSSVYNISTSRGTEVTVDLDGLTSGQMYYCKAAATKNNSNSQNCTFPGFGDVNVFISFRTASTPTASGTTKGNSPSLTGIVPAIVVPIITSLLVAMVITIVIAVICIRRKRTGDKTKRSTCTSQNLQMKQNEPYVRTVYDNDVMYDSLRTRSKQMNEANHTSTNDEAKHTYCTPERKTKPHPSYYTVPSTGHTYGLLENPNHMLKKKEITMEETYTQDTGQHIKMPITNDSYSLPLNQTSKHMRTAHNAVPPTQAEYEDVLSPANDGGYALPVDHKGIRLMTESTYI